MCIANNVIQDGQIQLQKHTHEKNDTMSPLKIGITIVMFSKESNLYNPQDNGFTIAILNMLKKFQVSMKTKKMQTVEYNKAVNSGHTSRIW